MRCCPDYSKTDCFPTRLNLCPYTQPGQGISSHIDTHSAFGDAILVVSLGAGHVVEFVDKVGSCNEMRIYAPRRSLYVMQGESRYEFNVIASEDSNYLDLDNQSEILSLKDYDGLMGSHVESLIYLMASWCPAREGSLLQFVQPEHHPIHAAVCSLGCVIAKMLAAPFCKMLATPFALCPKLNPNLHTYSHTHTLSISFTLITVIILQICLIKTLDPISTIT